MFMLMLTDYSLSLDPVWVARCKPTSYKQMSLPGKTTQLAERSFYHLEEKRTLPTLVRGKDWSLFEL